jgi:hypothetical protein
MKQLVIMPGGFHPFHAGHAALYQSAVEAFPGADVYVAATNDTSTRPFPFPVKEKLAQLAGVAPRRFVQVKSPFRAEEIVHKYNPDNTQLIFVRSEKDTGSQPQPGGTKKDGTPSYLQPYNDASDQPLSQRAYMAYLPTVGFGPGMTSATEIRGAWPTLNEKRKTALVMSLYPKTQTNPKLAATVVKLLDTAMGTELKEFAPGSGGGESGRWYTDDQMTDIVGDGWYNDLDVSGDIPKQQMIQQAQAWLDDQGYSVQVLNCKVNDDDMEWYIEGSFHNPRFAKKGVAEKLGDQRPKLGSKRDAGKSVRKWRNERGLDEVDAQNFVGGMTAGYQRRENQPVDENQGWAATYENTTSNPRVDLTPNYPNYATLVGEFIGVKKNRVLFRIVSAELNPGQGETEKIFRAMSTNTPIGIEISRVKNRAVLEALKPDAFAALQQAKQNIEQNRQQEVDQWTQDFRANSSKLAGQQLKQRLAAPPPAPIPVARPGEGFYALKDRLAQLDIAKQKFEEFNRLVASIKKKYPLVADTLDQLENSLLQDVKDGAADNYASLLTKLSKYEATLTTRFPGIVKEDPDYIDEYNNR